MTTPSGYATTGGMDYMDLSNASGTAGFISPGQQVYSSRPAAPLRKHSHLASMAVGGGEDFSIAMYQPHQHQPHHHHLSHDSPNEMEESMSGGSSQDFSPDNSGGGGGGGNGNGGNNNSGGAQGKTSGKGKRKSMTGGGGGGYTSSGGGGGGGAGTTGLTASGKPRKKKKPRIALSCRECTRRKQKCDRQTPCHHCICEFWVCGGRLEFDEELFRRRGGKKTDTDDGTGCLLIVYSEEGPASLCSLHPRGEPLHPGQHHPFRSCSNNHQPLLSVPHHPTPRPLTPRRLDGGFCFTNLSTVPVQHGPTELHPDLFEAYEHEFSGDVQP